MIRLIYAPPGTGKTALMVALGIQNMYGENAIRALEQAHAEVAMLNANGFNVTPPRSDHLVYCAKVTIDVTSPDFGHRRSLELDPARLGIAMDGFVPQFVYRGSTLCIDELPEVADSRNWGDFAEGMCRYWAKHRKHRINLYATCQDVSQVEKRIRIHAAVTEVRSMEQVFNKFDEAVQTVWQLNNWPRYADWECGAKPSQETYVYNGDIMEAYDTYDGEEDFYIGLSGQDFSCNYSGHADFSPAGIEQYAVKNPIVKKEKGAKKQ